MSEAPTYHEHVAGQPELAVVEFTSPPDAEAVALRAALVRVTDERNHWREQYLAAARREELLNARLARLLSIHSEIRKLTA